MKYTLLLIALIFSCMSAFSQSVDKSVYDNVYTFRTSETLLKCSGNGVAILGSDTDIPADVEFSVTKILDDGSLVIQFIEWRISDSDVKVQNTALNKSLVSTATDNSGKPGKKDIFFKLSLKEFNNDCEKEVNAHSFTLGALVLPIKLRFGGNTSNPAHHRDFTFANDISIGLSAGYKYSPNKKYSHNILTGIALTSVSVTPTNTNKTVTTESNLAAITWHFGYLFQIDNFQIGAFTGIDYLAGEVGRNWDYKNKPWFGIGLGYSIFKSKSSSDKQ
ncbi:hypothetical protein [Mucilaginibacter gilvus]|uniref:DUF3575 domain-containing protein n=1 Tax=Mucilaginibacter gilvus TaxID=2305909 RepID=A0A3S3UJP2_9SPHI|nr:hypothetical protein [Mucilaginibacter gilvus]RWY47955.1 hypothetical protein EPL05_20405 [Mucilaginibacter gilvus]